MTGFLKSELNSFLLAVQFLTRVPVPASVNYSAEHFAGSVRHYPLVGIFIGTFAAGVYFVANAFWPPVVAVIVSSAASILLTGAFHEDGLADMFDGIGGGTTPERALEIMKDSRIGTYGMLAAVIAFSLKISSLTLLSEEMVVVTLVAAHGLSRLSSVVVIATSRYVREQGKSKPVATGSSRAGLLYAFAVGGICCAGLFLCLSPVVMVAALGGLLVGHISARFIFERKLGGYTGDCLGATQQFSELGIYLGVLACR